MEWKFAFLKIFGKCSGMGWRLAFLKISVKEKN
jgi:hypothetical protein